MENVKPKEYIGLTGESSSLLWIARSRQAMAVEDKNFMRRSGLDSIVGVISTGHHSKIA